MIYLEKEKASKIDENTFTIPWWVARFQVNTWPSSVDFDGFLYRMDHFRRGEDGDILSVTYVCGDKRLIVTAD